MFNIFDLIFPKYCLECKKKGKYICANCLEKVPRLTGVTPVSAVWLYRGVIRRAILTLKYKYAFDIAEELSDLTAERIKKGGFNLPKKAILIPIPLHKKRENFRGFNQAGVVGKLLAKKMEWNYISDLLVRKTATASQTGLDRKSRAMNVHGVFVLNLKYQPLAISHQPLVLFDDVYTTGSTMEEAEKVLKDKGFTKIYKLTIAG